MQTEDLEEILKFSRFARLKDSKNNGFNMLKKMNKARIQYITQNSLIKNLQALDIGCGIGILSKELSRLGAKVTAIDPCSDAIKNAKSSDNSDTLYINTTVSDFYKNNQKFDTIFAMEVLEHVQDLYSFVQLCCRMLNPQGKFFFSTINKTLKSYIYAIIMAEYVCGLLPKKTHCWKKFVKPSEIARFMQENSMLLKDISGLQYNPFLDSWTLSNKVDTNYIGYGITNK